MGRASETFTAYDSADYLTGLDDAAGYMEATVDEADSDPAAIAHALGLVARSGNLSELAGQVGMSREGLHKALSADGDPSFATITKVAAALGLRVRFRPAE